jgi:hypothetical protein
VHEFLDCFLQGERFVSAFLLIYHFFLTGCPFVVSENSLQLESVEIQYGFDGGCSLLRGWTMARVRAYVSQFAFCFLDHFRENV